MGSLGETISELQRKAKHCAWLFQSYKQTTELQIVYAVGDQHPWRLLETHRALNDGIVMRRMHCFADVADLKRSIEERSRWKMRDRALCSAHLPESSLALAQRDPNDPRAYGGFNNALSALDEQRRALREQICVTRADRVRDLGTTPTFTTKRVHRVGDRDRE